MSQIDDTEWCYKVMTQSDDTKLWPKMIKKWSQNLMTQSDKKIDELKWWHKCMTKRDDTN